MWSRRLTRRYRRHGQSLPDIHVVEIDGVYRRKGVEVALFTLRDLRCHDNILC